MAAITFPVLRVVDDAGAVVTNPVVTIASVNDKAGVAVPSHGATINADGSNVSVDYDVLAHGEAWVTLAISKAGSTITGLNAAPSVYMTRDSALIAANLTTAPGSNLNLGMGTVAGSPAITDPTASDFYATGLPFGAASGEYNKQGMLFQSGGRQFAHRWFTTHSVVVVNGVHYHRFQFADGTGFAAAPAVGDQFDLT